MPDVFKKMNLKDETMIVALNAPASFEPELAMLHGVAVRRSLAAEADLHYVLAFVTKQAQVDEIARVADAAVRGDAQLWFAYPKGSSRNYTCEFNRDTGWAVLGGLGWQPVRQVAIDADWSALRFRRSAYVGK